MAKPLWAPWRLEYIQQADELEGCVFCLEASSELSDPGSLLVRRGASTIVVLNKFPYSSGHLLVAPIRHTQCRRHHPPSKPPGISCLSFHSHKAPGMKLPPAAGERRK